MLWNIALMFHLEDHYADRLKVLLVDRKIYYYGPQDLKIHPTTIGFGGTASVYSANWKNTSTIYAIKKFVDDKEVCLTYIANGHKNIIQFYGLTKSQDEKKYSLVLEYAEGGTLRDYLRNDAITFKWENQLKFAKEIVSAILWLHDVKEIIHGDLHPKNILIYKDTIKLADFGRSCMKDQITTLEHMVLGVLFWELTSRKSPFDFEKKTNDDHPSIIINILKRLREEPVENTNDKFVILYKKCWEHEPDNRPNILQVISELNCIDPENNNNVLTIPKETEKSEKTASVYSCQIEFK
ncbi:kinase-like domain-containing protein [Rhizophagus clarus]|uniref:Kinase-like domain-containing protein n=1 Tax=Rhizophagus clarus TaxID=94130 RepID=A0A8H3M0A8_9GLOM|nr:kinase-like domain-containing protein [Rhizophagus clarus]